jgi:hypothetical protein
VVKTQAVVVADMRASHRRKIVYYLTLLLSGHRLYSRGSIDADFENNHTTVIVLVVTLGRRLNPGCGYHLQVKLSSISGLPTQIRRLFFALRLNAARLRNGFYTLSIYKIHAQDRDGIK